LFSWQGAYASLPTWSEIQSYDKVLRLEGKGGMSSAAVDKLADRIRVYLHACTNFNRLAHTSANFGSNWFANY
jgi:hypothetical protein